MRSGGRVGWSIPNGSEAPMDTRTIAILALVIAVVLVVVLFVL